MKTIHVMAGSGTDPSQVVAATPCSSPTTEEDRKLMKEQGIELAKWMRRNIASGVYDQCMATLVSGEAAYHPELEPAAVYYRRNV